MPTVEIRLKELHVNQQRIINEAKRFNVLKCGRRFGKTELTKEITIEGAAAGKLIGYWAPTYKDLDKVWIEINAILFPLISKKNEQLKKITLVTGGGIDMWSLEDPNSGRGMSYDIAIIDEAEKVRHLKTAWEATIRGTLIDREGSAWFMSTPQFGDTYFKKLYKYAIEHPDDNWAAWIFTSYDNPFLSKTEIDEAKNLLHHTTFDCEYMAEDVELSYNPFCNQYDSDKHEKQEGVFYQPGRQTLLSIDFNLNPFALNVYQSFSDNNGIHVHQVDEVSIEHGSIPAMIDWIKAKYTTELPTLKLTGDYKGNDGQLSERDNASFYEQLKRGLNLRSNQIVLVPNPKHTNSRAGCNYFLANFPDFKINPKLCPDSARDMKVVQCDAFGQIVKKVRSDLTQQADHLDGFRYLINTFFRDWNEKHQKGWYKK